MEKIFVPHTLAIKLKEKGFDEPCFAVYFEGNFRYCSELWKENTIYNTAFSFEKDVTAPLYQQVVDWFRENHKIYISVMADNRPHRRVKAPFIYEAKKDKYYLPHDGEILENFPGRENDYYETFKEAIEKSLELI